MTVFDRTWDETEETSALRGPDFRGLLGEAAWARLPAPARARFAAHAEPRCYQGSMSVRASRLGWIIAQLCRLIGTPLAPWTGEATPVEVRVAPDPRGGLAWDRFYAFEGRPPVLVTSRKLMTRKGELIEIARGGLGMRLVVLEDGGALRFRSMGYIWRVFGVYIPIPGFVTPGEADVVHRDIGSGRFVFSMRFIHPWAGETFFQSGIFEDPRP